MKFSKAASPTKWGSSMNTMMQEMNKLKIVCCREHKTRHSPPPQVHNGYNASPNPTNVPHAWLSYNTDIPAWVIYRLQLGSYDRVNKSWMLSQETVTEYNISIANQHAIKLWRKMECGEKL
jgi:hypothetical protein